MNGELSRTYLLLLAAGIDPMTGKFLPEDSAVKRPAVVQALRDGAEALRLLQAEDSDNQRQRQRAGRPWTGQEERQLEQMYAEGASIEEMCRTLQRRRRSLEKRLQHLEAYRPDANRRGEIWLALEDDQLREEFARGTSEAEIAKIMHRSRWAIFCRLTRLGLVK